MSSESLSVSVTKFNGGVLIGGVFKQTTSWISCGEKYRQSEGSCGKPVHGLLPIGMNRIQVWAVTPLIWPNSARSLSTRGIRQGAHQTLPTRLQILWEMPGCVGKGSRRRSSRRSGKPLQSAYVRTLLPRLARRAGIAKRGPRPRAPAHSRPRAGQRRAAAARYPGPAGALVRGHHGPVHQAPRPPGADRVDAGCPAGLGTPSTWPRKSVFEPFLKPFKIS